MLGPAWRNEAGFCGVCQSTNGIGKVHNPLLSFCLSAGNVNTSRAKAPGPSLRVS